MNSLPRMACMALLLGFTIGEAKGETGLDPEVEAYNLRLGSQMFGSQYHFTTNALLIEAAEHLLAMGSDIIKFQIKGTASTDSIMSRLADPKYPQVFGMPFRHYFMWVFRSKHGADEYTQIKDFTAHLLTAYSHTGKSFYLGHWEGDWGLLGNYHMVSDNPDPERINENRHWLNERQRAVDDAKRETPHTNVNVFVYAEVNRVRDAMINGPDSNIRMINAVVPFVTNLDYVSYSAYDAQWLSEPEMIETLDYIESMLPTNKNVAIPGRRVFIGEYGFGGDKRPPDQQLEPTRTFLHRVLRWGVPFTLYWQVYNNEPGNFYSLIDEQGKPTPVHALHVAYLAEARRQVESFKAEHGRLPDDEEFNIIATRILDSVLRHPSGNGT